MNIGTIQQELKSALLNIYAENEATIITDWVMEHYTGKSRIQRLVEKNITLSDDQVNTIRLAKLQLLQHKPVQYVLKEAWFMGLNFFVNESVLVPRPETEELVELAIHNHTQHIEKIIDIGTGSACIPILLKKHLRQVSITAIDVSEKSLEIAHHNASKHQVDIEFYQIDFLDESQWSRLSLYNIIISNPPYIPLQEKNKMDKNVTAWEPDVALFVPDDDPLLFYKKIAVFGKTHLSANGKILVEIHQHFGIATKKIFEENGYKVELKKDIYKNDRILIISNS